MFFAELIIVLATALILTLIFGVGVAGRAWGAGLAAFFVVLFLATWAGGLWVGPYGPPLWGVAWLTFLLVGLFVVLILLALTPTQRRLGDSNVVIEEKRGDEKPQGDTEAMAIGAIFWILTVGLIIAIIAAHL